MSQSVATREMAVGRCPACGGSARSFARNEAVHLVCCRICGLVYLDPPPTAEANRRFSSEYDLAEKFAPWASRKRVLFERRLAQLSRPAPGHELACDVGCADGQFMEIAAEWGWRCSGIELNPPAVRRARERGFDVLEGDVLGLELPSDAYDLVTAWDVLEHVPDARAFAERLTRLVKPGGRIVVSTVNIASLAYRMFGLKWSLIHTDHFTYWDRSSLTRLMSAVGCEVLACSSFGLGRDFVSALDTLEARVRPSARVTPARAANAATFDPAGSGRWDVNRAVLALEGGINRALSWTSLGVDVMCVARLR